MRTDTIQRVRNNEVLAAVMLLSGVLAFYLPVSVAVRNTVFFVFSASHLALGLILLWAALAAALVACTALVPQRARPWWDAALVGTAVFAWLQGWVLTREYWEMYWQLPSRPRTELFSSDTLGAAAVFTAAAGIYTRWRAESVRFLWLVSAGLAVWTLAIAAAAPSKRLDFTAPGDLVRFSAGRNVVVVLLDAFQGDLFQEILDNEPNLRAAFDGFVYYRDATGVASSTHLSVPTIHSGRVYADAASIRQFYVEAVEEGSFMTHLARAGYVGTYVNPMMDGCPRDIDWCGHEAVIHDGLAPVYLRELRLLGEIALRRTLPGFARDSLFKNAPIDPDVHHRFQRGIELLDGITRNVAVENGPPRAKFLHLMTPHWPVRLGADFQRTVGRHWVRDDMRGQATCAVRTVARFLKALHKHGIYDQTTLVILADHGAGLPPLASSSSWTPKFQLLNAMADVLLLVKPAGSRGALATSWRPASLSDVSATICAESKACPMPTGGMALLGEPASHAARERQFMFYPWGFAEWTQDRVKVPERYRIVGRRVLQEAWLPAVPKREK